MATTASAHNVARPSHYGVVLFPGFEPMDVMGPLEVLTFLSREQGPMKLSILAKDSLDPVSTVDNLPDSPNRAFASYLVPQYTLASAPDDIDVLLVPGGFGLRADASELQPYADFIRERYPKLKFILSVCTGTVLLAKAGVLDGRKATTNKQGWKWSTPFGPNTEWVYKARWVKDGNVWTCSGVTAGVDGTLALVALLYGEETADHVAKGIEHVRISDPDNDPFATGEMLAI